VFGLAFGPLRPVGLEDPRTGRRPFAVVQLRREDAHGQLYNLVDDPNESNDVSADQQDRVTAMNADLEKWLRSVVKSLNGQDY